MLFAFDLISDLHVDTWPKPFDWTGQATSPIVWSPEMFAVIVSYWSKLSHIWGSAIPEVFSTSMAMTNIVGICQIWAKVIVN
jgi:hypothetical protein